MKKTLSLIFSCALALCSSAQQTPFEKSNGKETATYTELISYFKNITQKYPEAKLLEYGTTDIGKPLNLLVLSKSKDFDPVSLHTKGKAIILINNGIHPGEPEGIDATMMLVRDLLEKKQLPDNVVLCFIPVYNIDGMLNRGPNSRVNQNGPVEYGFRGNSRNLDLNRDCIKTDSRNSLAFQQIFQNWKPEVFLDNHTSNGADYQHVMTYIATQKDKLNPEVSAYMNNKLIPVLLAKMKERKFEMVPYVNVWGNTPDKGYEGFNDSPRYTTGYSTLFNSIGFVVETHMWKPFDQRVWATYAFMQELINQTEKDAKEIIDTKRKADEMVKNQTAFAMDWKVDTSKVEQIAFKGFEGKYKPSEVSGLDRLYYDRSAPFEKQIDYKNSFKPTQLVGKPWAYVISQSWGKVIELLKLNGVQMKPLTKDMALRGEMYFIDDYKTGTRPYEGHYLHSTIKVTKDTMNVQFYKGDYVVQVDQAVNRYIVETLEPQAIDSYFNWNFFDSILGQKEGFSDYLFEDIATEILKKDPELKAKLEEKRKADPKFAQSAYAQLDFIYKNSPYYEKTHNRYPIMRLLQPVYLGN
ncbi:M14 family metallopeptidase [Solitalea sp. MAHUQ-68]|uniref:M14 family metallopeptidase n=1 Tax=Solitalea agri TaxID=2953739 RepID=A0A9X2JBU2_9SPHI|nr:M14 family metallopeptidase [Solitalea agri]MCO4292837.1 M14 family metallopeptidase [Solitalea agri]